MRKPPYVDHFFQKVLILPKIGWYEIAPQAKKSDILHLKSDFCKGNPAFPMFKKNPKNAKTPLFEKKHLRDRTGI